MKTCSRCKESKPFSEFIKNSAKKDGYCNYCKICKRKIDREYYSKNTNRKNQVKERRDFQREKNKEIIKKEKEKGCIICGELEEVVLDFHHLNNEEKNESISNMTSFSAKKLKIEMKKCVVLCSNCHRKVHAGILNLPL